MKNICILASIVFISCAKTVESEEQVGSVRFASYDFAIIEYKTTTKKTGEVTERHVDTLLVIDCRHCKDICDEFEDR